jgi:hypothetical protein
VPTLLDTFEVREIAFAWGGVTRVFYNNYLEVLGDENLRTWEWSNDKIGYNFQGVHLLFDLSSPYLQRKSPQAAAGNDWIDVKNAILKQSVEVTFYPLYSLDQTVSVVIAPQEDRNVPVLSISRAMGYPRANLKFQTQEQLPEYPVWLRNTRYKG